MRKAVAILGVTGALTFGGAGVAHATMHEGPVPTTTTSLAQADTDDDGHNTGLWGLAGLLGLLGLLGLKRRNERPVSGAAAERPATAIRRASSNSAQVRPATCSTGWRADLIWSVQTPLSCRSQEPKRRTRMSSVLHYPTAE